MESEKKTFEKLLDKLVASTRSPRGLFSAKATYPILKKRINYSKHRPLTLRPILATAAAITLVLSFFWLITNSQPEQLIMASTLSETRTIRLSDGTNVTLNHYSSLSYPKHFKSENREVQLNGGAYFEVTKDKHHPFIVKAEDINVKVLGTHFNLDAYPDNQEIRTILYKGSVVVINKDHTEKMILCPLQMAIYNKGERSLKKDTVKNGENGIAWTHGELNFDQLPMQEIARELSNWFGIKIIIKDKALKDYRITARFRNGENITEILIVLQNIVNFNFSSKNPSIIIIQK